MLTCIPVSVVHLCEPRDSYGISRQHCCNRLEPRFNVFLLLNCFRNLIFHITFVTFLGQVANDDSIFLLGLSLAYGKMNNKASSISHHSPTQKQCLMESAFLHSWVKHFLVKFVGNISNLKCTEINISTST